MEDKDHSLIMSKIEQIFEANNRQNIQLDKIENLITGNGNPDNGLIVKSTKIASKVDGIVNTLKIHWGILGAILSGLIGISIKVVFNT